MYVKANTEVWCCLVLTDYSIKIPDEQQESLARCGDFFLNLLLHCCFSSCFSSGRRAGRKTWKGGEQECLLTCRLAHICSSLVDYNIIKIRRSQEISQAVKPIFSFLFTMYFTSPLAAILAAL